MLSFGYPERMVEMLETPEWLNYHHLRHFWMIARHRSMTRAAEALNISPSTLSEQLGELEEWLGQPLFERRGRTLHLTESGQVALQHAETIFETGRELMTSFRSANRGEQRVLRLGAVGPLSKNLQFDFIQPLLAGDRTKVVVVAGGLDQLARQLREHRLDLVLSNIPLRADQEHNVFNHLLGEVPVFLVGGRPLKGTRQRFPHFLRGRPLFLPSHQSHVRMDFDLLLRKAGIEPEVRAEVDDMALLRLLALSGEGLALVSKIVVERELESRQIKFMLRVPGLVERFYALTARKRFENAWLGTIVEAFRARLQILGSNARGRPQANG
ncbi:LysR family transcriptional regulator [Horticoccus sp. 23ND18S-11]|uniref:LysR family transcriptional regulator n=1 Tax=Horticoccus sp. 23ND18S-11 TaxID=3391832 RepID=UPI0039C9A556